MSLRQTNKAGNKKGLKHGGRYTPEYNSWMNMKGRCHNPRHPRYKEWGGRGIKVCKRWLHSFKNFYEDMGKKPGPRYSLDRIDSSRGYELGNCRWATPKQQSENRPTWVRMISFRGQSKTMTEWAVVVGIGRKALCGRFKRGWTVEEALTTPKLFGKRKKQRRTCD